MYYITTGTFTEAVPTVEYTPLEHKKTMFGVVERRERYGAKINKPAGRGEAFLNVPLGLFSSMVTMVAGGPGRDSLHSACVQEEKCKVNDQTGEPCDTKDYDDDSDDSDWLKKNKNIRAWCQSAIRWFNNRQRKSSCEIVLIWVKDYCFHWCNWGLELLLNNCPIMLQVFWELLR